MSTAAPSLHSIRPCLEGAIPAIMATCDPDGTPNVAYISQVVYVDAAHVALSFQFFNKTRQNILRNPRASVLVLDPLTAHFYRLHLLYERTEDCGPVFESMRAQLAGIASHSGMAEVFELKGADIYAVEHIESVAGEGLPAPAPRAGLLHTLRLCSEGIARCTGLDELLQGALQGLQDKLGIEHAMVLMLDASAQQLYTVASCGYATLGEHTSASIDHVELEIKQLLETLKNQALDTDTLCYGRHQALAYLNDLDTLEMQASVIGNLLAIGQPWTLIDDEAQQIRSITAEDILRVANTYFTPERLSVAHILPRTP